jgi:hypothetical protein
VSDSVPRSRRDRMRAITRQGHAGQTRNGGRLPYWVHTDAVADICDQALRQSGELAADEAEDLVLAAHGHDLYEDTDVTPAAIRDEFGPRVDDWIDGMTNHVGDHDRAEYMRHLAVSVDEVRVIKCADLIDNMLSVAYGLHDLGLEWAGGFFLPIAGETRSVLAATPFTRLPVTGAYLVALVEWAWHRLAGSIETATAVAATNNRGDTMTDDDNLTPEARAMIERLTFTDEQWAESKAATEAEAKRKAKELFGDQEPFAIPDTDTDA